MALPAATLANQSEFTFGGTKYTVTSVVVEAPTPEVANLTPVAGPVGQLLMVKTGDYTTPGKITVEGYGFSDPVAYVGLAPADAVFTTPKGSITKHCIMESARVEGRVGDVLRVSMSLMPTDFRE